MSLSYSVGRTLYRAILSAASTLDVELSRCESKSLRDREIETLRSAISSNLPRELRGLLEIDSNNNNNNNNNNPKSGIESGTGTVGTTHHHQHHQQQTILPYVRTCARRITEVSTADELRQLSLDGKAGFGTVRHLNERVEALRHMVYDTTSSAERFGIRVGVESEFQGADRNRYFFKYRVRILNTSDDTVKLLSRAWTIRDLDGRVTSVEGPGVVGAFPTLAPNQTYEYTSAVPLQTPLGTQSGYYMFVTLLEQDNNNSGGTELAKQSSSSSDGNRDVVENNTKMLQVPIAPFSHRTPSMDMGNQSNSSSGSSNSLDTSSSSSSFKSTRRKKRSKGANKDKDKDLDK